MSDSIEGTPPPQKSDSQSTDTSSQMEIEECSQSEEKVGGASSCQVDVDSGIENMEVEETKEPRLKVSQFYDYHFH